MQRFLAHTTSTTPRPFNINTMPKVELHVHLEATMTPALVRALASKYGIALSDNLFADDRIEWTDFVDFLKKYDEASQVACCAEAMMHITYDYLRRLHEQGCIYSELTVSPDHLVRAGVSYVDTVNAVAEGIKKARDEFGIESRMIVVLVRHDEDWKNGLEQAQKDAVRRCESLVDQVIANPHDLVVGIGLAGNEASYPPHLFVEAFRKAGEAGLQLTAHAGEWTDAQDVKNAIKLLNVRRVGHGIHAVFDDAVTALALERGIHFEACPDSNEILKTHERYPDHYGDTKHPLLLFREKGLRVSLSSDDPLFFRQLIDAHHHAVRLGLSHEDLLRMSLHGVEDSFAPESLKQQLVLRVMNYASQCGIRLESGRHPGLGLRKVM